jgi:enoyl-CoA hydratase/carnithine racemase
VKVNAFDWTMVLDGSRVLTAFEADRAVRVIDLASALGRYFSPAPTSRPFAIPTSTVWRSGAIACTGSSSNCETRAGHHWRPSATLAAKPSEGLARIRRSIITGGGTSFAEGLAIERRLVVGLAAKANIRGGVDAFSRKTTAG